MLHQYDAVYLKKYDTVAGIDEAGRGPLAGPVVAAAVILDPKHKIIGLRDSKKLQAIKRISLFEQIIATALAWSISVIDQQIIDEINILQATLKAMEEAVNKLKITPDFCLIDGNRIPQKLMGKSQCIIKGDDRSASIAAASIIAKISRDRIMEELDLIYPHYNFKQNKGYPTREHIKAIQKYGITSCHRRSFAPVRQVIIDFD